MQDIMVQIYWKRCRTISFISVLVIVLLFAIKFYYAQHYASHFYTDNKPVKTNNRVNIPVVINKSESENHDVEHTRNITHTEFLPRSKYIHAFYYAWFGNELVDNKYYHWNHQFLPHWKSEISKKYATGKRHKPPDDIGSNFYPVLGAYSSSDNTVIQQHMHYFLMAGIGVLALSWYPPGKSDDEGKPAEELVPKILAIANQYGVKVCFHIEPYADRSAASVVEDIKYLIEKYGDHPAFYKTSAHDSSISLPLVYVYDSYRISSTDWSKVLKPGRGIRGTANDAIVIGLLLSNAVQEIKDCGFDGFYTYFASPSVSYASNMNRWSSLAHLAQNYNLLFIPSIGPGYIDTNIRPWNAASTKSRESGKYYEDSWRKAISTKPRFISITSFNEWHEGTQVEPAATRKEIYADHPIGSFSPGKFIYDDYGVNPNRYLDLTKTWVEKFSKI